MKDYEWANSRLYPVSKAKFIMLLKKRLPPVDTYEMQPGDKISIRNEKLLIEFSEFIKKTGERIDFCDHPHPEPPPIKILQTLSKENWNEIVCHLKKIPSWFAWYMKNKFVDYLECIKANNYYIIIEVVGKNKNLTFMLHDRLQKITEISSPINWDYWFKYNGAILLQGINEPLFLPFYAYRNTSCSEQGRKKS